MVSATKPEAVEGFGEVNGNSNVWRYVSFEKFVALLQQRSLYFPRAANMPDRRDSAVPPRTVAALDEGYERSGIPDSQRATKVGRYLRELANVRQQFFINCWSLGTTESYALWRIYLSGSEVGVAIQSTLARLRDSIVAPTDGLGPIRWGKVQYEDYLLPDSVDPHTLLMTKSKAYAYESELRLIAPDPWYAQCDEHAEARAPGVNVPVDVERLVKRVFLSPFAPGWFRSVVEGVLRHYEPQLINRIEASDIEEV